MATFFLFLLILILVVFFIVLSFVGGILRGILGLFGIRSRKRKRRFFSEENYSDEKESPVSPQSEEGARRMRKFKNAAEDADYEEVDD